MTVPRMGGSAWSRLAAAAVARGLDLGKLAWVLACASCLMPEAHLESSDLDAQSARPSDRTQAADGGMPATKAQAKRSNDGADSGPAATPSGSESMSEPAMNVARCAPKAEPVARKAPRVHFLVDGSGSMNATFGDGTRWSVLRKALVDAGGVIDQLDDRVEFGLTIYSNKEPMTCPQLTEVEPALMSLAKLRAAYPAVEVGGGTPTGEALQHLVDALPDFSMRSDGTTIVVATDGEPNGCSATAACDWSANASGCLGNLVSSLSNAPPTYATTLAAVRAARAKNIRVWVVSLANDLAQIPDLQQTANLGAGLEATAKPGAQIYSPKSLTDLTETLGSLVPKQAAVSCELVLDGKLMLDRACEGSVALAGKKLACNAANGWKATDAKRITLQGDACEQLKSAPDASLTLSFPCDAFERE